jgi:hypothetical protein
MGPLPRREKEREYEGFEKKDAHGRFENLRVSSQG